MLRDRAEESTMCLPPPHPLTLPPLSLFALRRVALPALVIDRQDGFPEPIMKLFRSEAGRSTPQKVWADQDRRL